MSQKIKQKGLTVGKVFAKRAGVGKGGRETKKYESESNYNVLYT